MTTYNFSLRFKLPDSQPDPEKYLDALYEAGCDDASVGIGRLGMVALDFDREADTLGEARETAIANVLRAIPNATFVSGP